MLVGWKKSFGGLGVPELRRLRQQGDENRRLKRLVADLSFGRSILQESLRRGWLGPLDGAGLASR